MPKYFKRGRTRAIANAHYRRCLMGVQRTEHGCFTDETEAPPMRDERGPKFRRHRPATRHLSASWR